MNSQSNDRNRAPTELGQHYVYGRSSHRRNVASSHILLSIWFDYIAGLSQFGGRGPFYILKLFLPAFAAVTGGRGEGGEHPVGEGQCECRKLPKLSDWDCEQSADDVGRREYVFGGVSESAESIRKSRLGARNRFQESSLELSSQAT